MATSSASVTALMVIAAICLTIGYVVGWLISSLRGQPEEKPKEEINLAPQTPLEKTPPGIPAGMFREEMRLWREKSSQQLLVELDDHSLTSPELLTPEQRKAMEETSKDLSRWLGLSVSEEIAILPPQASPQVYSNESPYMEEPLRTSTILDGVTRGLADALQPMPVKKDELKSIVQQIDDVLQEKLEGSQYENEKIHLMEDARRGVIVWVGLKTYDGIDALPEGEVKEYIRGAVAEWEERQEQITRRNIIKNNLPNQ